MSATTVMDGVTEHREGLPVELAWSNDREVVVAANDAGFNFTHIDVVELISWLKRYRPELLKNYG